MFMMWDPMYWIIAAPALILALVAQWWVRHSYQKYLQVRNGANMTGIEATRHMMNRIGLRLNVEQAPGVLSDHYDPRSKTLRLSQEVANQPSITSVAIAAHELGHAHQDAQNYTPMRIRSGLVPVVNFTSWLGPILFLAGLWLSIQPIAWLGVLAFGGAAFFALVTLPVELNASRRGMQMLEQSGILTTADERKKAKRVLTAAALTYVAALAQAVSTMVYYVMLLSGGRRRR